MVEPISITTIVLGLLSFGSTAGVVFLTWSLNSKTVKDAEERQANLKRDERIVELEKSNIRAKNTYVTNTDLKIAIQEAFEPYKEDNKEIKLMLRSVSQELVNISRDLAVINAIRRSSSGSGHNSGSGGESSGDPS